MINSICNEFFHPDGPTVNPQYQAQKQDAIKKCQCDLRVKLVGDGCRYCNPQDYIDHLHDALAQKDTWIGLTDKEIEKCWVAAIKLNDGKWADITNQTFYHLVKIAEEMLMEKNHG